MRKHIMTKLLVVVSSADKAKIGLALGFSKNQKAAGHDVRLIFFGPSEAMVAKDQELAASVKEAFPDEKPRACVFVAENSGVKEELGKIAELVKAGQYITGSIDEGYSTISF